jgi:signal transduction histidine kinase
VEIDQIDCHFSPQDQINHYRLQLRSQGLAALAERVKLMQGSFDARGQIGGGAELSLAIFKNSGGLRQ